MNDMPIEQAKDADLRSSIVAMRRAAQRAREIAMRTGTPLVISRNGVIEYLMLTPASSEAPAQEPASRSEGKR